MNRRHVLGQLSMICASAWPWLRELSAESLLATGFEIHRHVSSRSSDEKETSGQNLRFFTAHQMETVDCVCELVIPQTTTPGARAAKVPQFIDLLLAERETHLQDGIAAGLRWLDKRSSQLFAKDFVGASPEQQVDLLTRMSLPESPEDTLGKVFFNQIKNLTAFGYYTSKEGLEQELGYAGPQGTGSYEGSAPV